MIYTVTLNPALDYIVTMDGFDMGHTNRTTTEQLLSGGKGINVSILLKNLGLESTALGFVAGFTGEKIKSDVSGMGIKSDFINVDSGYTRINLKLKDYDGTEINGMGPDIDETSVNKLFAQVKKLTSEDVVFLSGSIPKSLPQTIYTDLMKCADAKFVVDATGDLLLNTLAQKPFFIKPNIDELEAIFNEKIDNPIKYAKKLQEMGAQNVMVSMGGDGAVLFDADGGEHSAPAPTINLVNAVGAGDGMVAGFVAGWLESHDYKYAFKMGLAAGSASAATDGFASKDEIFRLLV